jgi:hypothetical protein
MRCESGNNCCAVMQLFGFNNQDTIYDLAETTDMWHGAEDAVQTVAFQTGHHEEHETPTSSQIIWHVAWDKPNMGCKRERSTVMPRYNAMCRYIKKHRLGTVTRIPEVINPNHDSWVKTAVWNINRDELYDWCDDRGLVNHAYDEFYGVEGYE